MGIVELTKGDFMKRELRILIINLIIILLAAAFIVISRNINKSKATEAISEFKKHPKRGDLYKLSPKNIRTVKRKLNGDYIRGLHYIPNEIHHKGVVITFGGSEGSIYETMADYLSSDGYEVVAVYYFGQQGQSENLSKVPLEIYEEIYSYIKINCKNIDQITIVGISRGAELALLMSTYYDSINNVVLFAPSSYVFGGIDYGNPAWIYEGKPLEYLNGEVKGIPFFQLTLCYGLNKPYKNIIGSDAIIKNSSNLEESRIKVEDSNARILIFYGTNDEVWNSKDMSKVIEEYAKKEVMVYEYKDAGHSFGSPMIIMNNMFNGGNLDANIEADLNSKKIVLETLKIWHDN